MATLADVLKAIKDLITVTEKVRDNTERIVKLEEKVDKLNEKVDIGFKNVAEEIHSLRMDMVDMRGDIKAILSQLKTEERIDTLESIVREHIAACEKAKA
jgi:vacuolar-type H+-ATPase subunit I/STV1